MNKTAPWPCFTDTEIAAVTAVLKSGKVNYWTGEQGRLFEKEFAQYVGCDHGIAVANGTVALDLALVAIGVGAGDEVIVTSRTFIASISAIVNAGATPVFADVDLDSQNITPITIKPLITGKTRAIICVHLAGWPCDMPDIMALAAEYKLKVIEDCAQAHGAKIGEQYLGSFGDIAAFSFCQDKIMSTGGEGGMVVTSNKPYWQAMWAYKDHGKSWPAVYEQEHPPGFRWLHEGFGTNWRLTEMQSAIGRYQLTQLEDWINRRQMLADHIYQVCRQYEWLRIPDIPATLKHAHYKAYVFIIPERLPKGMTREKLMLDLNQSGVFCMSGSCSEVYLEKAFDQCTFKPEKRLENAKILGETSLMFQVHPTITDADIGAIQVVLKEVFDRVGNP
ncbi:MAG: DegT/DnrJ/EryC1/StrS aminotransferase family protein [Methylococcales bacterium]|jgi:dTDP-4-amino-4,6-dideoxygalactose transaminase|nr:DegT/DnrJ/EryC1/StrS aminotransferase family protein [Methylococcales bacterium]